jgi:hypothetical protein
MVKLFADFLSPDPETAWKSAGKSLANPVDVARAKVVKSIDGALASLEAGEQEPKRGLYKIKADVARVTIRNGRTTLPIDGRDYNVVRADRLKAFFEAVRRAVELGDLDSDIMGEPRAEPVISNKRAAWSPERKALQAEKIKASWAKRKAGE